LRYIASAGMMIALSACSTPPVQTSNRSSPLVVASCPDLAPVPHQTFGDTVSALLSMYEQYHRCRTAALAQ
jgi:hypothetical protein